jgi:membrane protein
MKRIKVLKRFLKNELWATDIENAPKPKRYLINLTRIVMLGIRGFKEDNLDVRASALTYFTLLSIVPVLALGFGIAKGFGLEAVLEKEITKSLSGQQQVLDYILDFTRTLLSTANGGIIAGLGLILLLWSVIKLLSNIEVTFNNIWDVKKSRSIIRKFTDYTTIMLIAPIFIIVAGSVTVFLSTTISNIGHNTIFGFASPLLLKLAGIIPYLIIWGIFTILYMVMPNTKVSFKSAFIGGIIAGTTFQIFQNLYIYFQSGATRINAIYGSFAALPLFLIWLQSSWFVVLLGAEISFAVQNVKLKGSSLILRKLSIAYQKKIALLIVYQLIDDFKEGRKAPTSDRISSKTSVPIHTVDFILEKLVKSGIVSKVIVDEKQAFQPATDINKIDIISVINAYDRAGNDLSHFIKSNLFDDMMKRLELLEEAMKSNEKNILLKDLYAVR